MACSRNRSSPSGSRKCWSVSGSACRKKRSTSPRARDVTCLLSHRRPLMAEDNVVSDGREVAQVSRKKFPAGTAIAPSLPTRIAGEAMGILKFLGVAIIIVWLVLWLAVKVTFAAIHLLLLLGLALLVVGFVKATNKPG